MPASNLLTLIDDIATLLDDVAVLSKVAIKKTSGVLGDDLALNAEQVTGVDPAREIPVVLKVALGSLVNKVILVPTALLLSYFLPSVIPYLLLVGGLFLCFEGFSKVFEKFLQWRQSTEESLPSSRSQFSESEKIRGAVRTDFILSAEIIVISLGTVATEPLWKQSAVLVNISLLMTFGVYGLVAGIVKLDDLGLYWSKSSASGVKKMGQAVLASAPYTMKFLGALGTAAMFLVGGSLVVHFSTTLSQFQQSVLGFWGFLLDLAVGVLAGGLVYLGRKLIPSKT